MTSIRSTIARTAARAAVAAALVTVPAILTAAPAHAAPNTWGAIAISVQTGSIGVSYEYPTGDAAASRAVDECGASGCQEIVRVSNGCAAVAQAPNLAWGWAYGATRAAAEAEAVRQTPGDGARVLSWVCSGAYR